jgi:predicted aspartyl protease
MGFLQVKVLLANPLDARREAGIELMVDTGALYSYLPAGFLSALGIQPFEQVKFRLGDGRIIERPVGEARFIYNDKRGISKVVFAEPGDATVLGVVTLESLGLEVDPVRGELRPITAIFYPLPS